MKKRAFSISLHNKHIICARLWIYMKLTDFMWYIPFRCSKRKMIIYRNSTFYVAFHINYSMLNLSQIGIKRIFSGELRFFWTFFTGYIYIYQNIRTLLLCSLIHQSIYCLVLKLKAKWLCLKFDYKVNLTHTVVLSRISMWNAMHRQALH